MNISISRTDAVSLISILKAAKAGYEEQTRDQASSIVELAENPASGDFTDAVSRHREALAASGKCSQMIFALQSALIDDENQDLFPENGGHAAFTTDGENDEDGDDPDNNEDSCEREDCLGEAVCQGCGRILTEGECLYIPGPGGILLCTDCATRYSVPASRGCRCSSCGALVSEGDACIEYKDRCICNSCVGDNWVKIRPWA